MVDLNQLFSYLKDELGSPGLAKLPPDLYTKVAEYLTKAKKLSSGKDIPSQIRVKEIEVYRAVVERLLEVRIRKAMKLDELDDNLLRLLAEERVVLDSYFEARKQMRKVPEVIRQGKSAYLLKLARKRASKKVLVRFLKDFPAVTGMDLARYGPFRKEDLALIPYDNARVFLKSGVAVTVVTE